MFLKRFHLSAQELLLTADRELSPRRLARADRHIAQCPSCRARMKSVEQTLAKATQVCSQDLAAPLPPASSARARLRMQLRQLSKDPRPSAEVWIGRWVLACAAVLVAGVGILLLLAKPTTLLSSRPLDRESGVYLLPRADVTPGMTRPVSVDEVCGNGRYGRTQPIPTSVQQRVFETYGADYRRVTEYELDYLVTPELGGTPDARNLWPQPYSRTKWNAYVKDELELHFHKLVCEGRIDVATAQREIATDWIAAYKRHFDTDRPLRDYAALPLTERDGDLLRSELEELGIAVDAGQSDGATLMATLRAARQ